MYSSTLYITDYINGFKPPGKYKTSDNQSPERSRVSDDQAPAFSLRSVLN